MHVNQLLSSTCLASAALVAGWLFPHPPAAALPPDLARLQSEFHEANSTGDDDLMYSLWAVDAVFTSGAGTFVGRDDIVEFFTGNPSFGEVASLAPTYKSVYDIHGDTADYAFECIILTTSGQDPLATTFSTVPFGDQDPSVTIVQHSNASGTAVRRGNRWVFQTFNGGVGPLLP
jgi:hypothetical protein